VIVLCIVTLPMSKSVDEKLPRSGAVLSPEDSGAKLPVQEPGLGALDGDGKGECVSMERETRGRRTFEPMKAAAPI
jgi:hypothetical protein